MSVNVNLPNEVFFWGNLLIGGCLGAGFHCISLNSVLLTITKSTFLVARHRDSAAADSSPIDGGDSEAANAEKDILRYYYYIRHGIDTQHVAPMEQYWMDNVLSLVPKRLQVRARNFRFTIPH